MIRATNYTDKNGSWSGFIHCDAILLRIKTGSETINGSASTADDVWDHLPREVQEEILEKQLKLYVIDAYKVAREAGMGGRINTVMQTCFFAISGIMPKDQAIEHIKRAIRKTYAKKGEEIVQKNFAAVDQTLANLFEAKLRRESVPR